MAHPPRLWITIPAKPLAEGKSRLSAALTGQERQDLTRQLLERTLAVALSLERVAGVLVVSRDPDVLALAAQRGALALAEEFTGTFSVYGPEWGLNRAVEQAVAYVQERGGDALLFLPIDLPLLRAEDIQALAQAWAERENCLVIAPSHSGGTNGLLLSPPDVIAPAFGTGSFARHRLLAQQAGLRVEIVESANLAWDVDTPDEYALLVGNQQRAG
ncbi:MAG: 2-phospho-L-lactate guanylyltransferase [Caldilineaceae bacterium]|nr:2-phospho-L-lactate guanylyltransferase [Caldilineaceae bacterium]HRJ44913.1 2-phospho-L-lactate guanylyltransferase [Caldilineaceae bacterium]